MHAVVIVIGVSSNNRPTDSHMSIHSPLTERPSSTVRPRRSDVATEHPDVCHRPRPPVDVPETMLELHSKLDVVKLNASH
jgi:hypothetical protein